MPTSAAVVEKRVKALDYRKAGMTYQRIAEAMDCAQTTAFEYVQDALRETQREPADKVRELELERLDAMLRAIWPDVLKGNRLAIDRALGIMDRRSRYLGIDAPQRRIVEVTTHDEFSRLIKELEHEIGELEGDGQVEGEQVEA
jgi:threonine synthase